MKIYKPLISPFIQLLLFLFSTSSVKASCQFNGCYADSQRTIPRPCLASPISIAFKRNITATNTCGKPAAGYCELGPGGKCFECDANSTTKRHPPEFMVDSEFDTPYSPRQVTWWQSQTWWETNSTKNDPLKVNITLSFGRSFHISGFIIVRFYNERPLKLFLEKSKDFGKTWTVVQYFAFECEKSYNMPGTAPIIDKSPFNVTCTEDYSGQYPPRYGKVEYRFDSRYQPGCGYFDQDVQNFMLATNVRIRLEEPYTDGLGSLFPIEEYLNKYYYAISDIVITGRCNCNGHAQYCTGPRMEETCECEHNTAGTDCQICQPLFSNRPWMPANATHANECQECQCNSHGLSCTYNDTLGVGICTSCQHNTEGQHCEKCRPMFYRDSSIPIEHPSTCAACNCFPEGITNDGSCLQVATPTQEAGQCHCKNNVLGRRCDQCIPGYWGFRLNPPGQCRACGCNRFGTVNNTIQCDQYTGACPCMVSIQGRYCEECKDGFYFFPINLGQDCLRCPCDLGGAFPRCNKVTGSCSCRNGVEGSSCERSRQGRFYPFLDFIRIEAEDMNGTFTVLKPSDSRGVAFTGSGYAAFLPGQYAHISVPNISASHHYHAIIRYTISSNCIFGSEAKVTLKFEAITGFNDSVEFNIFLEQLSHGSGQAWRSPDTVKLFSGEVYNFTLIYNNTGGSDNCSFLLDSLVFLPDVNLTRAHTESSTDTRNKLQSCVKAKTSLSQIQSEPAYCKPLLFSVSTEIYNGTLACGCDPVGTAAGSQCVDYGGQCSCQPGVMGRTCTSCDVGYYGFSSAGCTRCQCSNTGSLDSACHVINGECHCKANVQGFNCDSCKPGTFNLELGNHRGCLHCFGYGHALSCTSARGFVASTITSQFVNETVFNWTIVNSTGESVPFTTSSVNGLVVTSPFSPPVVYLAAPSLFLGTQYRSYGQRLRVEMEIKDPGNGQNPPAANGDVVLISGAKEVALNFVPSPSPNVTSYHAVLDETHVVGASVTPLEFQSILAELTSLRIRATYYPFPQGSVTLKDITLETAVSGMGALGEVTVGFVENATCYMNYTGLSCEQCAQGFTREVNGSGPFGRCVLCSCNNRSTECDGETGACTNCQVGTYGDRCQLCTNNVQGPECNQCKPGYWWLSENGCQACDCYLPGTVFGNDSLCDQVTGQCNCNVTANIGGRRCHTCEENSWNTSAGLSNCEECSPCYSAIQEDVNSLRDKIVRLHVHLSTLQDHPIMLHNQTFVERLRQLVAEVSELTLTVNAALEVESNSTSQWLQFAVAVNDLSARLNETIANAVNQTLHYTGIVQANRRETKATVTQIQDVVNEASRLLDTPMRLKLEQTQVSSISLAHLAEQFVNVTYSMKEEENRTVLSNKTIHEGVENAVEIANKANEEAQNASDSQARVNASLRQLHENASAVNALGERTVGMLSDKLAIASTAYNHSLGQLHEATQPNPDRSSALQDLNRKSVITRNAASQYRTQVSSLYQSSTAVIVRVNAAVERSVVLGNEVRAVFTNATQARQDSQAALTTARDALFAANSVSDHAQRMLHVASKFETVSVQVQASANKALLSIPGVIQEIIQEVSVVNESSASTLSTATEAFHLGNEVHNLSISEQQVVERVLRIANQLRNETSAKNAVINTTVKDFIAREIEPVQKLCQNLSTMAFNVSENGAALLRRAAHVNTTAQRLSILIRRLLNESSHLPRINVDNLPTLRGEVSVARQQFGALQLGPRLVELRRGIQLQKEKIALYKDRFRRLRADIDQKKKLLRSLPSGTPC